MAAVTEILKFVFQIVANVMKFIIFDLLIDQLNPVDTFKRKNKQKWILEIYNIFN